jgi:hypothetical protein
MSLNWPAESKGNPQNPPRGSLGSPGAISPRLNPFPWDEPLPFQRHCQACPQGWLSHVFLFEAMGKSIADIAQMTGYTIHQVTRALNPDYRDRFPLCSDNDPMAWSSLSILVGSLHEQVKQDYDWQRRSLATFWVWRARQDAVLVATQYTLDCAPELQALANAAKRDRDRHNDAHQPSTQLPIQSQDPLLLAIHSCACEDARYAIGFEPMDQFHPDRKPIVLWVLEKMTFFQWFHDLPPEFRQETNPQILLQLAKAHKAHPWVIETLEESRQALTPTP